jgi:hypothetical protein
MSEMNRRDAVKLAASLSIGASVHAANKVPGQEDKKAVDPQPAKPTDDPLLELALKSPNLFMFDEQVTFKTSTTAPHTYHLMVSSVRDPLGSNNEGVDIPPGSMRIFRAGAGRDDFTKQGGLYWRCGDSQGKVKFKQPGALVMVVRDQDGTVRCYSLMLDFRC